MRLRTPGLAAAGTWRQRMSAPARHVFIVDEVTLLAHRALWVTEPVPHHADTIEHLDAAEQALYHGLRSDRWDAAWGRIQSFAFRLT